MSKSKKEAGLQSQLSLCNVREVLVKDMVAAELYIHLFKCGFRWELSTCLSLAPNISNKAVHYYTKKSLINFASQ